jgi:hypothetical protein
MREWVRAQVNAIPVFQTFPLVVTNETSAYGVDATWMRFSMQLGEAQVIGVGTAIKRRRRIGRLYLEIFGPINTGETEVTVASNEAELFLRQATEPTGHIHQDITLFEPSTFERPEGGRYCQVVNARIQVDLFS